MYGKSTQAAIAAVSRLAEVYNDGLRLSAVDIAQSRKLQRPFVAKILTVLAQARLVKGTPGPGGGYTLAMEPREITLYDVFKLFEREEEIHECPFGGGICGQDDPCPIHDKLDEINSATDRLLHGTTFDVFSSPENAEA